MLQLVPYFIYDFRSVLKIPDEEDEVVGGCIAVNALTSTWETWEPDFETVEEVSLTHERLEPKVDENGALEKAKEAARELSTKEIESVSEADHATIVERRVESPADEDVSISLPLTAVADILDSFDGETFEPSEALSALRRVSRTDLVHVRTDDETVKIWVW